MNAFDAATDFFRALEPLAGAYSHASVSFLAKEVRGQLIIERLLVQIAPLALAQERPIFRSESITAGRFRLEEAPKDFVLKLLERGAQTKFGALVFPAPAAGETRLFDPKGAQSFGRLSTFQATGASITEYFRQPDLDWELRAGRTPYSDLADLSNEYGVPTPLEYARLDVEAYMVAAVDFASPFKEGRVTPTVRLAGDLDKNKVGLGINVRSATKAISRDYQPGQSMEWERDPQNEEIWVGRSHLSTGDPSALVQCFVSYDGMPMHYGTLRDSSFAPNSARSIVELFDSGLEATGSALAPATQGRAKSQTIADDLEHAVSAVLWIMGFSVHRIGAGSKWRDAFDIIARTPKGNYLAVECTTGPLKQESKLSNLRVRSIALQRLVEGSWDNFARIIPVMVTALSRRDISAEKAEAERSGVAVFAAEDMLEILNSRTLLPPDPDQVFLEIEAHLQSAVSSAQKGVRPADASDA